MSKFTYTSFEDAFQFANSEVGEAFIKAHYVGMTAINGSSCYYIHLYRSPEAASLAVLSEYSEDGFWPDNDLFSVYAGYCDGELLFAADAGHNESMTHTDADGFISFLKGRNWLDPEWCADIYDLELHSKSSLPSTLKFDEKEPWTLHEARAIVRTADELLPAVAFYHSNSRPRVHKLDDNQAILVIFDDIVLKVYGILDAEGILELKQKLERFSINDVDYSIAMCDGLELCYYVSKERD